MELVIVCYRNDSDGEFLRVNYSQPQRDTHFSVPLNQVISWYEAYAAFTEAIYSPENTVYFRLKEGMSELGLPFFT
jgi:gamma-butyrobetaine dioxygenase